MNTETEYYIIETIKMNEPINYNLSKNKFEFWLKLIQKNISNKLISNKIYTKKIQHRYCIIQENILSDTFEYQHNHANSNQNDNSMFQNIVNYIQKFNEFYEDIYIPNVTYQYEFYSCPKIFIHNKNLFYSHKKQTKIIDKELSHSINAPTDLFEINEILYQTNNNLFISFSIAKDILNKNQDMFWIKFIEKHSNEFEEIIPNNFYKYISTIISNPL
jgi:hypothetical protein